MFTSGFICANNGIELSGLIATARYLESQAHVIRYIPVNDYHLQKQCHSDFVVLVSGSSGYDTLLVDSKTEVRWTGNIFLETISNMYREDEAGTFGWCSGDNPCHIIAYYFIGHPGELFIINMKQASSWIGDNIRNNRWKLVVQKKNKQMNTTVGYLVPLEELRREPFCYVWEVK